MQSGNFFRGGSLTLSEAYQTGMKRLKQAGCENPAFDTICLMEKNLRADRSKLAVFGDMPVEDALCSIFFQDIKKRMAGEPLQYILGEWEFMGLSFRVGKGVLIPRPDTETLVETALQELKKTECPRVLDLCGGSGCVGISIAKLCPSSQVSIVELSETAAVYLRENIQRNQATNASAILGDVLSGPESIQPLEPVAAVLSNPPYIPAEEICSLQREVLAEPEMALDGGKDGLLFYRAIAEKWFSCLAPGGFAAVECGIHQADDVARIFKSAGLQRVQRVKDLCGIERVVIGFTSGG